jgi:hypothetical protein
MPLSPISQEYPQRHNPGYRPTATLHAMAITQFFVTKTVPPHSKAVHTYSPEASYGSAKGVAAEV